MLMLMNSPQELHAQAAALAAEAVRSATPGQLALPTPCAGWDLAALLDHMTVQNLGFAAAAAGRGGRDEIWATGVDRADPIADYLASDAAIRAAFAEEGVLERPFTLPELSRERDFPGAQAIAMHTVDCVLHAWDVARALGRDIAPSDDLVKFTLDIGEQIPDTADRAEPGAHFAPRATLPPGATAWGTTLALYGRSPHWPAL